MCIIDLDIEHEMYSNENHPQAFQKFFECVKFAQIKKLIAKHEFHHFPISRTTMIFSVIVHRNLPFNRTIYIFNIPEKTGKLPNFSSLTNHDPEKRNKSEEKHRFITNSPSRFEKRIHHRHPRRL